MDGIIEYRDGLTLDIIMDKYPWLLEAEIEGATVGQNEDGFVWYYGRWKNGTFLSGTWKDGWFNGGTFASGVWETGSFYGDTFASGIWHSGWWNGENWKDGTWMEGKIWDNKINKWIESSVSPKEYNSK